MRKVLCFALVMVAMVVVGCQKERPDPRKQEGFVDTSDPSKVMGLSSDPNKPGAEDPAAKK